MEERWPGEEEELEMERWRGTLESLSDRAEPQILFLPLSIYNTLKTLICTQLLFFYFNSFNNYFNNSSLILLFLPSHFTIQFI